MSAHLRKNIGALLLLQVSSYVLPLISVPYLVRVLGPERFGLIAVAQALAAYFTVFSDYGFNLTATRQISVSRSDLDGVRRIYSEVTAAKFILLIFSFLCMALIVFLVPGFHAAAPVFYIAFLAVIGNVFLPVWLFQGLETMRVLAQWQIVARTGGTLLIFILVRDENDYLTAVLIQSSIILAAGAIVSAKALSLLGHVHKTNFTAIARQLREGWSVFLGTGAVTLYTTSNVLVVGLMAGNIQAGYYSAAEKMLMPVISVLIGVFGQALFPRIGALVHQDRSHALIFIRKVVVSFAVLGGVASIAVFSLASFAAKLIFGPQFLDTVTILKILSPLCLLIALSNAFGIQIMIPFGFQREFGRILLFAGLLHLISLLAASHFFGATGAAVSVVVTEGIVTLIMAASLLRRGIFSIENSSKASST